MDKIKSIAEPMLGNPSKKLKLFARGILLLGSLCSVIGGIIQWVTIGDFIAGLLAFLTTVIGGTLLAWFLALLIEGFAKIVANAETAENTEEPQPQDTEPQDVAPDGSWNCPCGRKNSSYVSTCVCGTQKREIITKNSET